MSTIVLPLNTYSVGAHSIGPVALPDGINFAQFSVQRCTSADTTIFADPASVVGVSWDESLDGGVSWFNVGAFTCTGGIVHDKQGAEAQFSSCTISFTAGTGRQLRAQANISGSPIKTSVQLTLT